MIGQTFNLLTVSEILPKTGKYRMWRCRCACGSEAVVNANNVKRGRQKSCGCLSAITSRDNGMKRKIDLIGQRFGRLVVVGIVEKTSRPRWLCQCDCGGAIEAYSHTLRSGGSRSCGCLARELVGERSRKHGAVGSLTYRSWAAMRQRCRDEKSIGYAYYGGRGIMVCERWDLSFENFLADMGERPSRLHSIDRFPNKDGNYEPGNCRWATASEQNSNRRTYKRRRKIEVRNEHR